MTSMLIDVYKEKTRVIYVDPNNFRSMYELLNCRIVTIETIKIGGRFYDIVCDDEALFHEPCKISAIDPLANPVLTGNLLVFRHGKKQMLPLLKEDIRYVQRFMQKIYTNFFPKGYVMLTGCEYQ